MQYYRLNIGGLERDLPICQLDENLAIAGFDSVGDTELINRAADILSNNNKVKDFLFDCIITTEVKGIPIAQALATRFNVPYFCLRKSPKIYMGDCVTIKGSSITSGNSTYYLSKSQLEKLKKLDALFVDDVYSTGTTMDMICEFCDANNIMLMGAAFILRETLLEDEYESFKHLATNGSVVNCVAIEALPLFGDGDDD